MFLVFALVCGCISFALYLYNKPHTDVGDVQPQLKVNAPDLFTTFFNDEQNANGQFLNKVILVSGKISSISRNENDVIIFLESNNLSGQVSCDLPGKNTSMSSLKNGQPVSIKGRCSGYLADVILSDCVVVP